jgi:hypothetical protein
MIINQLFIKTPPIDLINRIIKSFGLNDINDPREFSKIDMDKNKTLAYFHTLEKELGEYYIPCKRKEYIDNIKNILNKEAITIFRQLLKTYNYDLYSKERFIKGTKYLVYKIVTKIDKNKNTKKKKIVKEIIIVFD